MSDKRPTVWSAVRGLLHGFSELRRNLRHLRKTHAVFKTKLQEITAEPERYPSLKPELLSKLAEVEQLLSSKTIPSLQNRYRHLLFFDVFRVAPDVSLRSSAEQPAPPNGASFLLDLLLSQADRMVIPGDLEEEFATSVLPKYGARRARIWFWKQTVSTIATRNPVCRWVLVGGLMRLGEWIFRNTGG